MLETNEFKAEVPLRLHSALFDSHWLYGNTNYKVTFTLIKISSKTNIQAIHNKLSET